MPTQKGRVLESPSPLLLDLVPATLQSIPPHAHKRAAGRICHEYSILHRRSGFTSSCKEKGATHDDEGCKVQSGGVTEDILRAISRGLTLHPLHGGLPEAAAPVLKSWERLKIFSRAVLTSLASLIWHSGTQTSLENTRGACSGSSAMPTHTWSGAWKSAESRNAGSGRYC